MLYSSLAHPFKNSKSSGFTLIELLVAIILLSLLMITGYYSFSIFNNIWDKKNSEYATAIEQKSDIELTSSIIKDALPWVVVNESDKVPAFMFVGKKDSVFLVSKHGLKNSNYPAVYRIKSDINNNERRVMIEWVSTKELLLVGLNQPIQFKYKKPVFKNIINIEFRYFGWASFDDKNDSMPMEWFDEYSSVDKRLMPHKIEMTVIYENREIIKLLVLPQDASRWLLSYEDELM